MSQKLSDNQRVLAPKQFDDRTGVFDGTPLKWRPFNDIAEFNTSWPLIVRFATQTFWVKNEVDSNKADLYALRGDKTPYKLIEDVDLSNYYTKSEVGDLILIETDARIAADLLKADITYVDAADEELQDQVTQEVADRINGDQINENQIITNETESVNRDTELQNNIDTNTLKVTDALTNDGQFFVDFPQLIGQTPKLIYRGGTNTYKVGITANDTDVTFNSVNGRITFQNMLEAGTYVWAEYIGTGGSSGVDMSLYALKTDFKYVEREITPILGVGASVSIVGFDVIIVGSVGFQHGNGKYAILTPGTYALGSVQDLVASNIEKDKTYDGGFGNEPIVTPVYKIYTTASQNDVILATRDVSGNVISIWDTIGMPNQRLVPRVIEPGLFDVNSIAYARRVTTTYSVVIEGKCGFFHGIGQYAVVTPGTYVLAISRCLVVSNVNKKLRYDGTVGNQPILIPTVKVYADVTQNDVIIASRDSNNSVSTIWDDMLDTKYVSQGDISPVLLGGSLSKTADTYTITGGLGFYTGEGQYAVVPSGTYQMNSIECWTVSLLEKLFRYDGTGGNQPIPTPVKKLYTALSKFDIVVMWNGTSGGVQSIWDNYINSDSTVKLTNPFIEKTPWKSFFDILYTRQNAKGLWLGNSIWASSNWWGYGAFPVGLPYSTKVGLDSEQPFQMTDNILSRKFYDLVMTYSLNTPVYRRFDHGSTFDYDAESPTFGEDTTPLDKFFTESGTFGTWVSSDGNGVTSGEYGTYGADAQIPMTLTDATAAYIGQTWYRSGAEEGFTRKSRSANAYIEFTIPAGYEKVWVKLRKSLDGDVISTALTNCTGVSSVNLSYGTVTHTNNSYFIDVEFAITNTANPATIRLTKTSATNKELLYWGVVYFNEPCILANNYAYGGSTTAINFNVLPDLLSAHSYDFIVYEPMLINDFVAVGSTYDTAKVAHEAYADALLAYGKPVVVIIPHKGSQYGLEGVDAMWGMAKQIYLDRGFHFIDLGVIEGSVIQQIGRTEGLKYLYSTFGGVHPVGQGIDTLAIMFDTFIKN